MKRRILLLVAAALVALAAQAQRTILAVGAHAGDMEFTCGALLLKESQRGDRVVLLHLTRGNPALAPEAYAEQKRKEATAAAAAPGAEVIFGPYRDGEVPDADEGRRYVAGIIRQVRPALVITHWRKSVHKDHVATNAIVSDAVFLATLEGVLSSQPVWRSVRSIWYAGTWEGGRASRRTSTSISPVSFRAGARR